MVVRTEQMVVKKRTAFCTIRVFFFDRLLTLVTKPFSVVVRFHENYPRRERDLLDLRVM